MSFGENETRKIRERLFDALSGVNRDVSGNILSRLNPQVDTKLIDVINESIISSVKDNLRKKKNMRFQDQEIWQLRPFLDAYRLKAFSVIQNIESKRNPVFRNKILSGEIKPENVGQMTPEEMFPEHYLAAKKRAAELQGKESEGVKGMFICSKCKSDKTTYHQMQTRSADEPMTTFVLCTNCGNRWRF